MTLDEYKEKIKEAEKYYEALKRSIQREYAYSKSTVKIGDTVTDHIGSVLVETIGLHIEYDGTPSCLYSGLELKKDGTPTKKLTKRTVYQGNLKDVK